MKSRSYIASAGCLALGSLIAGSLIGIAAAPSGVRAAEAVSAEPSTAGDVALQLDLQLDDSASIPAPQETQDLAPAETPAQDAIQDEEAADLTDSAPEASVPEENPDDGDALPDDNAAAADNPASEEESLPVAGASPSVPQDPATLDAPLVEAASTGDFAVTGGTYGSDYTYADHVLTVLTSTPLTIAMAEPGSTTTTDSIVIKSPSMAFVTLSDLSIDLSATGNQMKTWGTAAIDIQSGGATLTIKGTNVLKSGSMQAGIQSGSGKHLPVTPSHPIVIEALNDHLYAYGGYMAAGIGSGYQAASEAGITISGGYIYAYGGYQGAGIGGAAAAWGSNITVQDIAHVYAYGGEGAAGIGGGYAQPGNDITLYPSVVLATGGAGGAGVGGGSNAFVPSDNILVSGAALTAVAGDSAAAIGGGKGAGVYTVAIEDGYIKLAGANNGAELIGHGAGSQVSADRQITGGFFVEGDEHNATVYGMPVASGYMVERITRLHLDESYDYHVIPARGSGEQPSEPETPTEPEQPSQPAQPEQPSQPAQPTQPQHPASAQPSASTRPAGAQVPKTGDATTEVGVLAGLGAAITGLACALRGRARREG